MLNTSRQMTMSGAGPIPVSEVLAYMCVKGIEDTEERERYVLFVAALDVVYMEHVQAKQKAEQAKRGRGN